MGTKMTNYIIWTKDYVWEARIRTETMYNFLLKNWLLGTWKKVLKAEQIFPFSMSEYLYYYIVKINSRANPYWLTCSWNKWDPLALCFHWNWLLFTFSWWSSPKTQIGSQKNTSGISMWIRSFIFYPRSWRRLPNFWVNQRCTVWGI